MEEIKKCMRQVKTIISVNCGVIDTAGKILAATNEIGEEETDPSFRAVVSSDNLFASTADRTYLKVFIGEQLKYGKGTGTLSVGGRVVTELAMAFSLVDK